MPKKVPDLQEKYPRKQSEGQKMDYTDSNLAFPKKGKKKNGRVKHK